MEIVARITSDATVTKTKSGKEVVGFSVAINDYYKPKDGQGVQLNTFVRCAYCFSTAVAGCLLKGVLVQLSGRLGDHLPGCQYQTAREAGDRHCSGGRGNCRPCKR